MLSSMPNVYKLMKRMQVSDAYCRQAGPGHCRVVAVGPLGAADDWFEVDAEETTLGILVLHKILHFNIILFERMMLKCISCIHSISCSSNSCSSEGVPSRQFASE